MTLFAHIVDGVLQSVGPLPPSARRLDTGEVITDLAGTGAKWRRAAGYYDIEADLDQIPATEDQLDAIREQIGAATVRRDRREDFVVENEAAWLAARAAGRDHLDQIPPPPTPPAVGAPGIEQIAYLRDAVIYLYGRVQQITRWLVGVTDQPGLGDVVIVLSRVVADLVEQADQVVPPNGPAEFMTEEP